MKTYTEECDELYDNGGILKDEHGTCYYKPGYMPHRVDGPAVEWDNDYKTWWYNGEWIMSTISDPTSEQLIDFRLRIL